jgi:ribulose-phosphate 3-epimerase
MILAPSVLCCDLSELGEEVRRVERGGADVIHVDVMDGQFVPNLTLGPAVVKAIRSVTQLPIDAHLMVRDGDRHVDAFIDAGASWISLHVEAVVHLQRALAHLKGRGVRAGVVLNPSTPLVALDEVLHEADYVLLMSVNPGFGGQEFLPATLDRIRRLRQRVRELGLETHIQVDGGIDADNAREVVDAGADVLVVGTGVFGGGDAEAAARRLKEICT